MNTEQNDIVLSDLAEMLCEAAVYDPAYCLFTSISPVPCNHPAFVRHGALYEVAMLNGQRLYAKPEPDFDSVNGIKLLFFSTTSDREEALRVLRTRHPDDINWHVDSNIAIEFPIDEEL